MLKYPFNVGAGIDPQKLITQPYIAGVHAGTDYALLRRTAIIATAEGRVSMTNDTETRNWLANTQNDPFLTLAQKLLLKTGKFNRKLTTNDYGKFVKLDHGNDAYGNHIETLSSHLDEVVVKVGDRVVIGQLIGYSDSTGNSSGDHLHHEIRKNERVIDPATIDLNFEGATIGEAKVFEYLGTIEVTASAGLNVRTGPGRNYPLSKNTVATKLNKGDKFKVIGYVEGENVDGNPIWWLTWRGNFVWSGGTIVPVKVQNLFNLSGGQIMSDELKTLKEELATLEKRQNEIPVEIANLKEEDMKNDAKLPELRKKIIELEAAPAVEPVVETPAVVEEKIEAVVEPAVEEVKTLTPEQEVAQTQIDELMAKSKQIDELVAGIKARAGL